MPIFKFVFVLFLHMGWFLPYICSFCMAQKLLNFYTSNRLNIIPEMRGLLENSTNLVYRYKDSLEDNSF